MAPRILSRIFGQRNESLLDLDTPIDEIEFAVFDTELTGLNQRQDSIVSIGGVKMHGGRIEVGTPFYRVVSPRTKLTGKSIVIHGITPSETEGCPDMDSLLPEFLDFCGDRVLVGHFVSMDIGFVNAEMKRTMGATLDNASLDTVALYRAIRQCDSDRCAYYDENSENANLFHLADKYGIEVSGAHNALSDAYITAQLFQKFISILQARGARTLKDLLRAGKP